MGIPLMVGLQRPTPDDNYGTSMMPHLRISSLGACTYGSGNDARKKEQQEYSQGIKQ